MPSSAPEFLDFDAAVFYTITDLLPLRDLVCLSRTCKYVYSLVNSGSYATNLWRKQTIKLVGEGPAELHKLATCNSTTDNAAYWKWLARNAYELQTLSWWKEGSSRLHDGITVPVHDLQPLDTARLHSSLGNMVAASGSALQMGCTVHDWVKSATWSYTAGTMALKTSLARTGHSATELGSLVVILGGLMRDMTVTMEPLILHMSSLKVTKPIEHGMRPLPRMHHAATPFSVMPGSLVEVQLAAVVGCTQAVHDGYAVAMFGGYSEDGQVATGNGIEVVWINRQGTALHWVHMDTYGDIPCGRHHHSLNSFCNGHTLVLYGGEILTPAGNCQLPSTAFILNTSSLRWTAHPTVAPPGTLGCCPPCERALHIAAIRPSPCGQLEELVVVGGMHGQDAVPMVPMALDLRSFRWSMPKRYRRVWQALMEGGEAEEALHIGVAMPDQVFLPCAHLRCGTWQLGDRWLLVLAGHTDQPKAPFLQDIQKLHLPSLTWRTPPRVLGQPSWLATRIAGLSIAGGVTFGGLVNSIVGLMPVVKLDLLLLGDPLGEGGRDTGSWTPSGQLDPSDSSEGDDDDAGGQDGDGRDVQAQQLALGRPSNSSECSTQSQVSTSVASTSDSPTHGGKRPRHHAIAPAGTSATQSSSLVSSPAGSSDFSICSSSSTTTTDAGASTSNRHSTVTSRILAAVASSGTPSAGPSGASLANSWERGISRSYFQAAPSWAHGSLPEVLTTGILPAAAVPALASTLGQQQQRPNSQDSSVTASSTPPDSGRLEVAAPDWGSSGWSCVEDLGCNQSDLLLAVYEEATAKMLAYQRRTAEQAMNAAAAAVASQDGQGKCLQGSNVGAVDGAHDALDTAVRPCGNSTPEQDGQGLAIMPKAVELELAAGTVASADVTSRAGVLPAGHRNGAEEESLVQAAGLRRRVKAAVVSQFRRLRALDGYSISRAAISEPAFAMLLCWAAMAVLLLATVMLQLPAEQVPV